MERFYSEMEHQKSEESKAENTAVNEGVQSVQSVNVNMRTGSSLNNSFLDTIQNCDDISGQKCQAPVKNEWSGTNYHNAMIMSVVETDKADDILVKVVFLNPITEQMKLCPYLLDEKCRFSEEDCKYSHGHAVSLYELRKFKEPDFSNCAVGTSCLAKYPSGLWGLAMVDEVLDDHQYAIRFQHHKTTCNLGVSDVLPYSDDESDSDDSDSFSDDDGVSFCSTRQIIDDSEFGAWENHTRGIGSKIMKKLGYKPGQGLGKEAQGRVDPVPVQVLPPGKSLDHCMNLKERKKSAADKKAQLGRAARRYRPPSVFQFLNKTLGGASKSHASTSGGARLIDGKDSFGIRQNGSASSRKLIGTEMLRNDSKMKSVKARVDKLKESVARNRQRNPLVAKQLQAKLNVAMAELATLQSSNQAMEAHQKRSDTHRKMTKF